MKKLRNFLTNNRAVTAVETAIIAPVLLALLLGIIEFGLTMFYDSSLNTGIRNVGRTGVATGYTNSSQINAIMGTSLGGLYDSTRATFIMRSYNSFSDPAFVTDRAAFVANPSSFFASAAPGTITIPANQSGEIVLYGVQYKWGGFTGFWPFVPQNLYSFSIVRDESF